MKTTLARHAILLLSSLAPLLAAADNYHVNFPADTKIDGSVRAINSVSLVSPAAGAQDIAVGQAADNLLYHDCTAKCFIAVPGEVVTPTFAWSGNWMHGYVYLDRGNDGVFDVVPTTTDGKTLYGGDVMAYSNYDSYNSAGTQTGNGNVGVNPPSFTMPALAPGLYRMRYKVDWNFIDPGGNDDNGTLHKQTIVANNGGIADVMVYVLNLSNGLVVNSAHGSVCNNAGSTLSQDDITPGKELQLVLMPDQGYMVSGVTVESGYDISLPEGVELARPALAHASMQLPAYLIIDNKITVPAANTFGAVKITVNYIAKGENEGDDYACTLSGTKDEGDGVHSVSLSSGANGSVTSEVDVKSTARHFFFQDKTLHAYKDSPITPGASYTGSATTLNLYVDLNHDGAFTAGIGELVATAPTGNALPAFTLPAELAPGVYRARIEAEGINAVDFLLNLHNTEGKVSMAVQNGYVLAARSSKAVPASVAFGTTDFKLVPYATLPGYEASSLVVRHGHNLNGEQYVHGNRQWNEVEISATSPSTLDAADIDGDILVIGTFEPTEDCEWTQIWNDEFDAPEMDTTKWGYHPRYSSAWNRFIAKGDECPIVNKFEDGMYTAYCTATPEQFAATETQPMISGAIYTAGKFYCTGGWIEARIKTTPHSGNFPAFWMMPVTSMTWPTGGEIDIWEQINNENVAYHTIHSAWANPNDHKLGKPEKPSPQKGGTTSVTSADWHIYALEWDQDALKFYVDGKHSFTYANTHYSDPIYTEYLAWPFSKSFYIICNQSVGNGSWAANPDTQFTYHTEFDYVRVYQKKDQLEYYSKADGHVSGIGQVVSEEDEDIDAPLECYNMQGLRVDPDTAVPGLYILRKGKHTYKRIIQ